MPVTPEVPHPGRGLGPLRWVAERPGYPKILLWDRDRDEWCAGVGAAAIYRPDETSTTATIERELSRRAAHEPADGPGWIGGMRFAVNRPAGAVWDAFGAALWLRPRCWSMRYDGVERTGEETGGDESIASAPVSGTHSVASPASGESSEVYLERVRAALVELDRAQLDKIVLARCVHRPGSVDPVATLSRMASTESGGTLYWIALDENEGFLGLTPETLYRRRGVRVETEALAGTSGPRDVDGLALLRDAKSLREHAYVRDAIVQALTPIAAELDVAADPVLHRMSRLHHLRTPITATLREAQPLLSRLHPTPAVCGTPHAAAEQAIARLEAKDRGFYAGAIGWCRRDGESIHVALRGARYSRGGCLAHLGAGIVRGSVPEAELRELELKAEALFESFAAVGNEATA